MLIHRFQYTGQHQKELDILMGSLARIKKILAVVRRKRPVIMLTGTIYPGKRLLMEQTFHSMPASYPLQGLHHQMIMVNRHIRLRIDRRQLMLCRRNLVMLRLRRHSNLPQFFIHILHESRDSLPDGSKVMII